LEFKIQTIEKLFYYIVASSYLLIPICLLSKKVRKQGMIPFVLGIYGIICFLALFSFRLEIIPKEYRTYYYILYTTFEYLIFAFIFLDFISSKKIKNLIKILSLTYILFQAIYLLTAKKLLLDTVPIGIETILIFTFITYSFLDFSKNFAGQNVFNNYIFWIAVGVLIYLGGSFFFYILINQLNRDERETFVSITYAAEIIKNFLFIVAIFIYARYPFENQKKNSNSVPYLDMI
jgi:hypothetical protein